MLKKVYSGRMYFRPRYAVSLAVFQRRKTVLKKRGEKIPGQIGMEKDEGNNVPGSIGHSYMKGNSKITTVTYVH